MLAPHKNVFSLNVLLSVCFCTGLCNRMYSTFLANGASTLCRAHLHYAHSVLGSCHQPKCFTSKLQ